MAIGFNIQFRVNPTTQSYVIRLTDTSTGFTLSKGNFVINYPDGSIRHYVDFNTPDISAPLGYVDVVAPTDTSGSVLTGSYTFNFITLDSSLTERPLTRTINFDWIAPTVTINNISDSALPEVKFQDVTAYTPSGSFTGVVTSRTFSVAMPSTSAVSGTTPSTSTAILDAVVASNYYEGDYVPSLSTVITYTHTSISGLTVLLTSVTTKAFSIKKAPTRNELVTRINAFRAIIDGYKTKNDTQFQILTTQYDTLISLYFHLIERVYSSTLDGSQDILNEILNILNTYTSYTYQSGPISAFYIAPLGSGTVSSVDLSVPTGFAVSGNPVTTAGTLALAFASGYSLPSNTLQATWTAKQNALNGTGFVKSVAGVISYDNSTYLSSITSANVIAALGYTPYSSANPSNYVALGSLSSTATGLTYTNTTGVFSLTSGYVIPTTTSASNWDSAYTNRITSLTTTGTSGAASISSNVLNIPNYTLSGLGGQASSVNLTSLSTLTYASTAFVKMTNSGTFSLDTNTYLTSASATSNYVPYSGANSSVTLGANNISANAFLSGFTSVVASASAITLTILSTPFYVVTGSGGQVIKLPNANTLPNGTQFYFNNNQSSGAIIVNNNSNTLVVSVPSGGYTSVTLLDNTNAAGNWDRHDLSPANVIWSTNTFDYAGSITSATWNGNVVQHNRGGTGQSTYTDGQLLIGNSSGNTLSKATLTGGTGITITNGNGSITISENSINGTINTIPKFTSTTAIGNSNITDTGSLVTINGLNKFIGTTASDTAPLGSELAGVTGTGANWALAGTSLNVGGYTHTTGSTTALTTTLAAVIGTYYQITYTISGRTAGSITIAYGGTSTSGITASGNTGPLASSTAVLAITPTTDFDGTVVLSIKSIGTSSATTTFANSSAIANIEVRANSNIATTFIGSNAGSRNTTGSNNTFIGSSAGKNNTTGISNTFVGDSAGGSNTIGSQNTFIGQSVGGSTIGGGNVAIGSYGTFGSNTTGNNNTSIGNGSLVNSLGSSNSVLGYQGLYNLSLGNNNIVLGYQSGRYFGGSPANALTALDNSILIGFQAYAGGNSQTNQIVIGYNTTGLGSNTTVLGNSSTATTAIYGNLLLGTTTDAGYKLDITGSLIFRSLTGASDRVLYVTSTGVVTQATIGSGLSFSAGTLSATGTASGSIGGSGTAGYIPKFTGTAAIGDSNIQDSGSLITLGSNTYISSGSLGIGTTSLTGYVLNIAKNITGATTSYGIRSQGTVQSDVTTLVSNYGSLMNTAASVTLVDYVHHRSMQGTIGSGSTVTNQYGYFADSSMTGATNNYGFYGNIPSGSNRWNIYMNGTANNYLAGGLGIGTTNIGGIYGNISIAKTITGGTVARGIYMSSSIQSDVTSVAVLYATDAATQATSGYILGNLIHYRAAVAGFGAGSTVTTQTGFEVLSSLNGATNNYGFRGQIASATNNWNLYMDGAAKNYLAGTLLIGSSTDAGYKLDVTGSTRLNGLSIFQGTTASDLAPLGSEIATTGSGTNWTGTSFASGYTHTAGSTANLTDSSVAVIGTTYRVAVTITGRTAGSITIYYGGEFVVSGQSTTRQWARQAITTAGLVVTPTSDFDGTVVFNINSVGNSSASITFTNSSGGVSFEIRNDNNTSNLFIGTNAGRKSVNVLNNNTQNTFIGNLAGQNNSNGRFNVFVGYGAAFSNASGESITAIGNNSLYNNTTGTFNTAIGQNSLGGNTTGGYNVGVGTNALNGNTTGVNNIAIGHNAGQYISNGSTLNTITNSSIFIGAGSRALADSQTNQIVIGSDITGLGSNSTIIGNTSTTLTALYGAVILGATSINSSAQFQVDSTTKGVLFPRMTTTQKNAISSPATGLVVFDTTLGKLCVYSTTWQTITSI